jgi:hypothetical protein
LLPTNKKTICKYSIPCRSDGQAASVLNANSKDERDAPSQVLIDCIPVKRQLFSRFLGHYPEMECMDQCINPKKVGFLLRTDNPENAKERLRQFCKMMWLYAGKS